MAIRVLKKYDGKKLAWLHAAERFAFLLLLMFLLFRFVLGVGWVSGHSMDPTYNEGTAVVYLRPLQSFEVGDVVAVRMAYGEFYIKRVVALGGDTITIENDALFINGEKENGPWVGAPTQEQSDAMAFPYTVPPRTYFVVGDNRPVSIDSRTFGAVSSSQILGRVLFSIG